MTALIKRAWKRPQYPFRGFQGRNLIGRGYLGSFRKDHGWFAVVGDTELLRKGVLRVGFFPKKGRKSWFGMTPI